MSDRKRIGLLGGSFNPAHRGHLHISEAALNRLNLDEVWWLVSPQNPLKSADGMADMDDRIAAAKAYASNPDIIISDLERELGTVYTIDTLVALKQKFPGHRFVWLMGADNLRQIPKWKDWRRIFRLVPIAIFPRPSYSTRALAGKAARRFAKHRIRETRASRLASMRPPAWVYLHTEPDTTSATRIRARQALLKGSE